MSLPDFTTTLPSLDEVQMADFNLEFDLEDLEQPTFGLDDIDMLLDPEQPEDLPQVNPSDEFIFDAEFLAELTGPTETQVPALPEVVPQVVPSDEFAFDAELLADLTDLTETEMPTQPAPSLWHDRYGLPITGPSAGIPSPAMPFVPITPLPLQRTQTLRWPSTTGRPTWWKPTLPPPPAPRRTPFNPSRYLYLAESTLGITGPDPGPKCNPAFMWYGSGATPFPPPGKPMPTQRGRKAQSDHDDLAAQTPTNAYELRRALIPTLATTPDEEAVRALLAPQMYAPYPLSLYPHFVREPSTTLTLIIRRRAKWLGDAETALGASAAAPPPLIADVAPGHTYKLHTTLQSPMDSPLTPLPETSLFCTPTRANVTFATTVTDAMRSPDMPAEEDEEEDEDEESEADIPDIFSPTPSLTPSPSPSLPTRHHRRPNLLPLSHSRPDSFTTKRLASRARAQNDRDVLRAKWPGKSLAQAKKAEAEAEAKARKTEDRARKAEDSAPETAAGKARKDAKAGVKEDKVKGGRVGKTGKAR